jgi:branched-chain amino acid transport system substrate-binding protein
MPRLFGQFSERVSRRAFSIAGIAFALSLAGAGAGCDKKDDAIVVGAYFSLSGSDSTFGADSRDGIELALTETNAAGGVKGKQVKVLYEDDKSTPQEASNKVRQLIDRDHAVAILGEVASSRSMAGGLIANTKHVPMVTPSSTAVEVTKDREYVFRVCFTDAQQGDVAARFVHDTLKKQKVGIFFAAQDNYSSGLAQSFKDSFKKLGGDVVIEKGYQKGETNFTTYLNELKAANPDLIYVPNYYNDMVQIARQAKQVGIPGNMFMGGDGWDSSDLIEGAGAELEGAYFTDHYAPDVPWPNSAKFVAAFKTKYGHDPSSLSAQAYDAAKLLFDAISRSTDGSPDAIKTALAATKDFQGATGSLTIDKDHNASKPIVVVQVKNKKFAYLAQLMSQSGN